MVYDRLERLDFYSALIPHHASLRSWLDTHDLTSLEVGRHVIDDDTLFVLIQEYETKPESEKRWESHRKYIDIQVVLSGEEWMGAAAMETLDLAEPYNAEKDVAFHAAKPGDRALCRGAAGNAICAVAGDFCVFFPADAHKPGFFSAGEASMKIRKAVIKVAVAG